MSSRPVTLVRRNSYEARPFGPSPPLRLAGSPARRKRLHRSWDTPSIFRVDRRARGRNTTDLARPAILIGRTARRRGGMVDEHRLSIYTFRLVGKAGGSSIARRDIRMALWHRYSRRTGRAARSYFDRWEAGAVHLSPWSPPRVLLIA